MCWVDQPPRMRATCGRPPAFDRCRGSTGRFASCATFAVARTVRGHCKQPRAEQLVEVGVSTELPVELGIVVLEESAIIVTEGRVTLVPLRHVGEVATPPVVHAEVDSVDRRHVDIRERFVRVTYEAC